MFAAIARESNFGCRQTIELVKLHKTSKNAREGLSADNELNPKFEMDNLVFVSPTQPQHGGTLNFVQTFNYKDFTTKNYFFVVENFEYEEEEVYLP